MRPSRTTKTAALAKIQADANFVEDANPRQCSKKTPRRRDVDQYGLPTKDAVLKMPSAPFVTINLEETIRPDDW